MNKPANNTNAKVRNTLIAALNLIKERDNWIKGRFTDGFDRYCMLGAVNASVGNPYLNSKCVEVLKSNMPKMFRYHLGGAMSFNDAPNTTHKMITNLFKRAIKSLE